MSLFAVATNATSTAYGLHFADYAVIVAYLVGITALGFWASYGIKSMGDYFMPRRFGKGMMTTYAFGTGTASDQAVSVAAETFHSGLSGIWWQWVWLPVTPFYWLIAPVMRRFRAITTADIYKLRFNSSVAVLFAVVGILGLSVKLGLLLKGSGAIVESTTGGAIGSNVAILTMTFLFVLYGSAGGTGATIVTDFVQGIMTLVFSFLLLPFVLAAVGGLAGIKTTLVDSPEMFSLIAPGEIGLFFVLMYAVQGLVGIVAQPYMVSLCSTGRTEFDCRFGFMFGNILKRICTAAWTITAMGAVAYYLQTGVPREAIQPDSVYGDMARTFLVPVAPGLLGLFIASVIATVMSTCVAMMVSSAALFTKNIYKPLVAARTEMHYVAVGRLASVFAVAGGLWFAWYVPDVITALKIWFRIAPMMGIAFWMALFWKRMTPAGAWAVTVTGFAAWYVVSQSWFVAYAAQLPFADVAKFVSYGRDNVPVIYEPWVIVFYTASAMLAGLLVSLVTKNTSTEKLDLFYTLIHVPVQPGETLSNPCTLPDGFTPPERKLLLARWGIEIPRPSLVSLAGFVVGWIMVIGMIVGFALIAQ